MSLALVFSLVPWASVVPVAAAEEAAPVETVTDMQNALTQVNPEKQESVADYGLLDMTVSGKVATVTYSAPEDATILVSIYSEDGKHAPCA